MSRSLHLAEFSTPPLDEVVLGVQFEPPQEFRSVNVSEVWNLFKDMYPVVEDQPLLMPQFETFGAGFGQAGFQFQFGSAPVGSRQWFVSSDGSSLIQFQSDRLLTNWRKRPSNSPYPRFDSIMRNFQDNFEKLEIYFDTAFSYDLKINQCEVSYINVIPLESFSDAVNWLSLCGNGFDGAETLSLNFSKVISNESNAPFARLVVTVQSVLLSDTNGPAVNLTLTVRGLPSGEGISGARNFFECAREKIVETFSTVTTPTSHAYWGRFDAGK
mgnify:CR=1 FL=1